VRQIRRSSLGVLVAAFYHNGVAWNRGFAHLSARGEKKAIAADFFSVGCAVSMPSLTKIAP
jgi:hypothetical protein